MQFMSQAGSNRTATATAGDSSEESWASVQDPTERRKIQNRIAQRKFREKVKQKREEEERNADNAQRAAGTYRTAEPHEVHSHEESGLPWGGLSVGHVFATGKAKEHSSRESSIYAAASKAGGSSRLGLHLIEQYARGSPAWAAWRDRFTPLAAEPITSLALWSHAPT